MEHCITEDVDNTENELFESAHFNMEEQIYNRLKQFTTDNMLHFVEHSR